MQLLKSNQRLAAILAGVIALIIVGGLVWGFAQQLMLAQKIQDEETQLKQEVATEQAYHDYLLDQLEYVKSDEYVEYWARTKAHMTRLGEVVVVILTDEN
jgi:cell division protein FtsB